MILAIPFLFMITLTPPEAPPDLCPLVAELNAVIAENSALVPAPCPQIGFAALPVGSALRSQAGAYLTETGAIELASDLDLTTAYGQSYLLHELVHAAQYAGGVHMQVTCPQKLEAEAYALQADFLRDRGLPREAILIRVLGAHLGSCGGDGY